MLLVAARGWKEEKAKRSQGPYYDDRIPFEPDVEVLTDEDAADVADTAHLTGDAEFDAIELAETSRTDVDWQAEYEAYMKEKGIRG